MWQCFSFLNGQDQKNSVAIQVRGRRTNFGRGRRGRYRNDPHSTRHERAVTNVVAEPTPQLESREFDPYQDSVVQQPDMDSGDRWKKNR